MEFSEIETLVDSSSLDELEEEDEEIDELELLEEELDEMLEEELPLTSQAESNKSGKSVKRMPFFIYPAFYKRIFSRRFTMT